MQKIKVIYHVIFWVFVYFFVFDYMMDYYDIFLALFLTFLEIVIYIIIVYVNLYLLIPKLLQEKGNITYILSLVLFLAIFYTLYSFTDLGLYLIGGSVWRNIVTFALNYLMFILISFLFWYFTLYRDEKQNRLELQNKKLQAELLLLKSQVSPHFLFNSLNNIYSLSVVKNDNAPVMIEKLSDILRYIIYEGKNQFVPMEREIELLNNFIDLQLLKKLKAEKNISVSFNGVSSLHKIVPLLLINIIENCFKHSDIGYNANGFLRINLKVNVNEMRFIAENSFLKSNKEPGIGLINLEKQLQHYYPDKHELIIEEMTGVYKVDMTIDLAI